MQQHQRLQELSPLAFFMLVCLVDGPKRATILHEFVIQTGGFVIEPGAFSRMLVRLERQGWIVGDDGGEGWRRYQITGLGMLALRDYERSNQKHDERVSDERRGKERIMPLVFWILRLYPSRWRERYEAEMVALLEEHHITLWTILDLLIGALDARLDPHYRQAHQQLYLRRFKSSWRLLVASFVVFWFALLPWFFLSQVGIDDANCSDGMWGGNVGLCMLRKTMGTSRYSEWGLLIALILIFLPILLIIFMTMLMMARSKKANTHVMLAQTVTVGMIALCLICGVWLSTIWQLLPQIGRYYPQTPAGLVIGIVGMGLAAVLAQRSLLRAKLALKDMQKAVPRQEGERQETPMVLQAISPVREKPATSSAESQGTRKRAKAEWVGLLGLLLLFLIPWPTLMNGNSPIFPTLLFYWLLALVVGLITAWLVREPDRQREQRVRSKPWWVASPLWWAVLLPIPSLLFALPGIGSAIMNLDATGMYDPSLLYALSSLGSELGRWPLLLAGLVSVATVLIVKLRMSHLRINSLVSLCVLSVGSIFTIQAMKQAMPFPHHPWPLLLLVSLVSVIPAFFVSVPTRPQQVETASEPQEPGSGATPQVLSWVLFLLVCNIVYVYISNVLFFQTFPFPNWLVPPWIGGNEMLLSIVMGICLIPALVVKIQASNRRATGMRETAPNAVSPKAWIVVLPVVFLTFVTEINTIFGPDLSTFVNVFNIWLLTGEAVLIMLFAFRLGSRKRHVMPERQLLQAQMQEHVVP